MKIIYNINFLSKEEVEKIKYDNNDIELIGRDLTPDTPQGDLLHSICLLVINFVFELSQGLITNYIYDLIKTSYNNSKQKRVYWRNSAGREALAVSEVTINDRKGHTVSLILKREPTETEILNINDTIRHLKSENYIIQLNDDGRINIWNMQEYGEYQLEQQEKR